MRLFKLFVLILLSYGIMLSCSGSGSQILKAPAKIEGVVYEAESGNPVANATVNIIYDDPQLNTTPKTLRTDPSGKYLITGFYRSPLKLNISAPKFEEMTVAITKEEFDNASGNNYQFHKEVPLQRKFTSILGRIVRNDTFEPIPEVTIQTKPTTQILASNEEGKFEIQIREDVDKFQNGITLILTHYMFKTETKEAMLELYERNDFGDIQLKASDVGPDPTEGVKTGAIQKTNVEMVNPVPKTTSNKAADEKKKKTDPKKKKK